MYAKAVATHLAAHKLSIVTKNPVNHCDWRGFLANGEKGAIGHVSDRAEKVLGLEVNIRRISAKEWSQGSPFISTIKKNPHVMLNLYADQQ